MAEERRAGHSELVEAIKEIKDDIKELKADIKADLHEIESKVHENITNNNKFYFNGFEPHKHVADHHIIDNIIEKANSDKKSIRSISEKWIDRAAFAAMTYIAFSTWNSFKEDVKAPPTPPAIEKKTDASTTSHP